MDYGNLLRINIYMQVPRIMPKPPVSILKVPPPPPQATLISWSDILKRA